MKKTLQSYVKIAIIAILTVMLSVAAIACGEVDDSSNSETPVTKYKISFVCEGETLKVLEVNEGEMPVYDGETPAKASTADKVFTFKGWNPALTEATADATYVAEFDEAVRKYSVKIGDAEANEVAYGSLLVKPADPTKAMTESTVYTFDGWYNGETKWNFETDTVTSDVTLVAKFNETARKYSVKIGDAEATEIAYGSLLEKPADPTKAMTESTVYTFDGWYNGETKWNFETDTVTGDVTLVAKFNESVRKYSVKIGDAEATEIAYGSLLEKPADPTKAMTESTVYTFDGWYNGETKWNFETDTVTGDVTLVAKFNESVRKYLVKIGDAEATEVAYGSLLEKPVDPTKDMTESTVYEFDAWYNGETEWDFETDTVTGDVTLVAKFNESLRIYQVIVDGVESDYEFGSKVVKPQAKNGCLIVGKTADGTEWKFDYDVVTGNVAITTENRLILAKGSELYAYKEWTSEDTNAIIELNGMEKGTVHRNPANFEGNGIRVAVAANTNVTVIFPKINFNAYGKTEFKFICNWGTRLIHVGDTVEDGDANKLGSYKGNEGDSWAEYYVIAIEGTSIKMFDKSGAEISTWIDGVLTSVKISDAVASGEEALKLTLSGGGQNLEFSNFFCHLAANDDKVAVHEWTADEVADAECRYSNLTYTRIADNATPTGKWAFDWQGRVKASGAGYAGVKIPLINFNNYDSVSFYVYCNWGSRTMKTGDSSWYDQYTVGTVSNTGDTYEQYGIITVKNGKMYFRLNVDETETEVRTLTASILSGTENIVLSFKDGGGNNIVLSDFYCSAEDYIKGLN